MDKNLGQDTSWGLKIGGCVSYDELEDNQLHLLPWLHLSTQAYIVFDLYILKSLHLVPLSLDLNCFAPLARPLFGGQPSRAPGVAQILNFLCLQSPSHPQTLPVGREWRTNEQEKIPLFPPLLTLHMAARWAVLVPIVASHFPHFPIQRTFANSRLGKIQSDSATILIADIIIPPAFSQCISAGSPSMPTEIH